MTTRSAVTRLALLAAAAAALGAAAPPVREIRADLAHVKGPHKKAFRACVGAGRANEGLRADWQEQLRMVHRELGFEAIRMHGVLHDDMGVYSVDREGRPVYNWQYVDRLYDFITSIGMRPFVELSFMPSALASGGKTIFWWKGNVTPPKSYARWGELTGAFVRHLIERYGRAEVAQWRFEVWNEPNLDAFWSGTQEDYFALYDHTTAAIKAVCPECRVGGPATAGNAWVSETIAHCREKDVPLDFVATHDYAIAKGYVDERGQQATVFDPDPQAITKNVLASRRRIDASAMPGLELDYTEWSASYTPSDPIHDSYHEAAFILDKLKGTENAAASMSYWVFSDIFEEAGPRTTPFHGGFGLLNLQGIKKAAYYAYEFLERLGDTEIATSDPASWVCRSADGIQVLFWDFTITHPGEGTSDQEFYKRDLPAHPKGSARVRLSGVPAGAYALEVRRVGYRQNDAYATYRDLGAPAALTRAQVEMIQAANDGGPALREIARVGADGTFDRSLTLAENDVVLVTLRRLDDAPATTGP